MTLVEDENRAKRGISLGCGCEEREGEQRERDRGEVCCVCHVMVWLFLLFRCCFVEGHHQEPAAAHPQDHAFPQLVPWHAAVD
jgi:hypothetical protein